VYQFQQAAVQASAKHPKQSILQMTYNVINNLYNLADKTPAKVWHNHIVFD